MSITWLFSYQLPKRNKCYLLGEHNGLNTFSDLTKMLGPCTEWLNICKRSLPVPNNFHFLFLYLSLDATSFSVPTEAIGLYNIGQSCCLNSLLQVFLMNIHFTGILRRYHRFELLEILPLLLCCLHSFFFVLIWDVHLKAWISKVLSALSAKSPPCCVCHIQTSACRGRSFSLLTCYSSLIRVPFAQQKAVVLN